MSASSSGLCSAGWINQKVDIRQIHHERGQERIMAKNHYSTKPKRRNRSGKRQDSKRIAANMAKIKALESAESKASTK